MCGIVTIFNYNTSEPVNRDELIRIRDHMTRRGPDGCGEWYSNDNRVGMGHRRLAIIDLSESGSQPMCNEDGTVWITFNGEIYNYQALRSELLAQGHRFKSTSDTEVIIHGYEEWGIEELLKQLRGMFAFAIYDSSSSLSTLDSKLFIARDPLGIKPLYYADDGKTVRVASQVKALLAGGKIDTSPEPAGHVGFFLWGHVPEPYTLYKGIRSLPAGSYMLASDEASRTLNIEPRTYFSISSIFADAEKNSVTFSEEEMHDYLRSALIDSVSHHLIADVPVGLFLSSGLDSTTLVALASEIKKSPLDTITLGFREYIDTPNDETALATLVADQFGTNQHTIWVGKADFKIEYERMIDAMDQPTIDGINSYFVSRAAQKAGLKVALSGLGGDELFAGYSTFSEIPRMVKVFSSFGTVPWLGRSFRVVTSPFIRQMISPKYAGLFEYGPTYAGAYLLRRSMHMPWELPEILDPDMVREGWKTLNTMKHLTESFSGVETDRLKVSALEMVWYMRNQLLRDTDWASMAHSLEIRVPLVDVHLLHALCPLLSTSHGAPDKNDMARTPSQELPEEVLKKKKTGFSIPVRDWIMEADGTTSARGLRNWSMQVYSRMSGAQVLNKKNRDIRKKEKRCLQ